MTDLHMLLPEYNGRPFHLSKVDGHLTQLVDCESLLRASDDDHAADELGFFSRSLTLSLSHSHTLTHTLSLSLSLTHTLSLDQVDVVLTTKSKQLHTDGCQENRRSHPTLTPTRASLSPIVVS
jgi:hypothetical protein